MQQLPVASLPPYYQAQVTAGIEVASLEAARATVDQLRQAAARCAEPTPTPKPTPTSTAPPKGTATPKISTTPKATPRTTVSATPTPNGPATSTSASPSPGEC